MPHINQLTRNILKPVVQKSAHWLSARIILEWTQIVGESFAKQIYPVKVTKDKANQHKLMVMCSGAAAVQLPYQKASLLSKINRYFGQEIITDITIKNATINQKKPFFPKSIAYIDLPIEMQEIISNIDDEDLKQALSDLACKIYGKQQ